MPKVVNGFSWKFVCTMTNLYRIGGDPLTQLIYYYYYYFYFFFHKKR